MHRRSYFTVTGAKELFKENNLNKINDKDSYLCRNI